MTFGTNSNVCASSSIYARLILSKGNIQRWKHEIRGFLKPIPIHLIQCSTQASKEAFGHEFFLPEKLPEPIQGCFRALDSAVLTDGWACGLTYHSQTGWTRKVDW